MKLWHIGIGTPITERPSRNTGHTDRVSGGSVVAFGYAGTRRLIKAGTDKTTSALPGLKEPDVTDIFPPAAVLYDAYKNMLFDSHDHLPVPFDAGTVRAFAGVSPPRTIPTQLVSSGYYVLQASLFELRPDMLLTSLARHSPQGDGGCPITL